MTETEVKVYGNGEKRISIYNEDGDNDTHGSILFGYENTRSGFMITINVAGSSEVIPLHEICYTLKRNEVYVLQGAIEAFLKMQPKNTQMVEE